LQDAPPYRNKAIATKLDVQQKGCAGVDDIALDLGLSANITEPFPAGVLRFALPLTSSEEEIDFGLSVLDESITRVVETAGN